MDGWTGVVPFGWRRPEQDETWRGLALLLDDHEAELLREAAQRVIGGASTREVAHRWNERGERTRAGSWWRDTSLRRMLRRPYLAGWMPEGDDVRRNGEGEPATVVEPLLSQQAYERLQEALAPRSKSPKRSSSKPSLLAGLLRCAECGGPMRGRHSDDPSASYSCSRRSTQGEQVCPGNSVGVVHLDAYVREWLKGYLSPPVVRDLKAARKAACDEAKGLVASLREALRSLENDRYEGGLYQGERGEATFRVRHADLAERLDAAEAVLLELESSPLDLVLKRARGGKLPWTKLSDGEVRELALSTIEAIEVSKGQRGRPFSRERVNIIPAA